MSNNEEVINYTIQPHGGELINRVIDGEQRERLIEEAAAYKSITLNLWEIFDLELYRYWWIQSFNWIFE